jgi:ribA/ribD-fused uncharacterized protein
MEIKKITIISAIALVTAFSVYTVVNKRASDGAFYFTPSASQAEPLRITEITSFWHEDEPNGQFSNWYAAGFNTPDGIHWSNAEQYIMGRKALLFGDRETYLKIQKNSDPARVKSLGKSVKNFNQATWDNYVYSIAVDAARLKIQQNPWLKELLLRTGNSLIAEASPFDKIWGIGISADKIPGYVQSGTPFPGQNIQGRALMQVRKEAREGKI